MKQKVIGDQEVEKVDRLIYAYRHQLKNLTDNLEQTSFMDRSLEERVEDHKGFVKDLESIRTLLT